MKSTLHYLRLLLWLKSRLLWRTYTRNTSAAIGALLLVLFFGPMSLLLALGSAAGFHYLSVDLRGHLLRAVLLGLYAIWLFQPILGYVITEDFDIGKLLLYPIDPRQLLTGVIAGSVLDLGFLLLLPTLIVVLVSFSPGLLPFLLTALILLVFLFHTIAASQALSFAGAGIARSRRGKEIIMFLVSAISIGLYALFQLAPRAVMDRDWSHLIPHFVAGVPWKVLSLLPPGLAGQAISAAAQGRSLISFGLLCVLTALALATLAIVSRLVNLVYTGEVITGPARVRVRAAHPRPVTTTPSSGKLFGLRLPAVVEAVMDKEVRYLYREPYFKFALLQVCYIVVIAVVMTRQVGGHVEVFGGGMIWFLTVMVLFMESQVLFNIFGVEGAAATTLFLYPGSRRDLLLGKNLVFGSVFALANLVVGALFSVIAGIPERAATLVLWLELSLVLFLAVGNIASVWFPYRVVMRGWRIERHSASRNWAYVVAHMLFGMATLVLLLPVLAAVLVPTFWVNAAWLALTLPVAAAYVTGLYLLSLHFGEKLLLQREMQIAEQLSQVDS